MMVRLNTRHELPQIGIRQTQGRLDESAIIQPQVHGRNVQSSSNKGATQPSLTMDAYPSRRAYGHRTMRDLTAEQGSRGKSDVQAATSRHSAEAWNKATNAAKRGDNVTQEIRAEMFSKYDAHVVFTYSGIPSPEVQVNQGEVVGEPDLGDISVDIETAPRARIHYTPGSVETYLKNEGFIRHWVSFGKYDVSA